MIRNESINSFDPNGHLTITTNSAENRDCGGRHVKWFFDLDSADEYNAGGYIVQKITIYEEKRGCFHPPVEKAPTSPKNVYYEAWQVGVGQSRPVLRRGDFDDQSMLPEQQESSGINVAVGEVRFYTFERTGNLDEKWGQQVPEAVNLASTYNKPDFWKEPPDEGPEKRLASSWWNCCCEWPPLRNELEYEPEIR